MIMHRWCCMWPLRLPSTASHHTQARTGIGPPNAPRRGCRPWRARPSGEATAGGPRLLDGQRPGGASDLVFTSSAAAVSSVSARFVFIRTSVSRMNAKAVESTKYAWQPVCTHSATAQTTAIAASSGRCWRLNAVRHFEPAAAWGCFEYALQTRAEQPQLWPQACCTNQHPSLSLSPDRLYPSHVAFVAPSWTLRPR